MHSLSSMICSVTRSFSRDIRKSSTVIEVAGDKKSPWESPFSDYLGKMGGSLRDNEERGRRAWWKHLNGAYSCWRKEVLLCLSIENVLRFLTAYSQSRPRPVSTSETRLGNYLCFLHLQFNETSNHDKI